MSAQTEAKYKDLAEHARLLLFREQDRVARIDQKAAILLSALSLFVGVAGVLGKSVVDSSVPPPPNCTALVSWDWWVLIATATMFSLLAAGWVAFFFTIKVSRFKSLALNNEVLEFCRENSGVQFNYYLAQRSTEAFEQVRAVTERKAASLRLGTQICVVALVACVVVSALYTRNQWTKSTPMQGTEPMAGGERNQGSGGDTSATSKPQDAQPAPEPEPEPDPTIEGPENINVTEGYESTDGDRESDGSDE